MEIIDLKNGKVKITSPNGILDIRINKVYSEVVVAKESAKYFIEYIG